MPPRVVSVSCPNCGAALHVDAQTSMAECRFCGTSSIVERPRRPTSVTTETQSRIVITEAQEKQLSGGTAAGIVIAVGGIAMVAIAAVVVLIAVKAGGVHNESPEFTFAKLEGCTCKSASFGLELYSTGKSDEYRPLVFMKVAGQETPYRLEAGTDGAPATVVTRYVSMVIGCNSKLVAIAMGKFVSAYSLKDGARVWSTELDTPLEGAVALPPKGSASVVCTASGETDPMPIKTESGQIWIDLAKGRLRKGP